MAIEYTLRHERNGVKFATWTEQVSGRDITIEVPIRGEKTEEEIQALMEAAQADISSQPEF